jgi:hypothetical protein
MTVKIFGLTKADMLNASTAVKYIAGLASAASVDAKQVSILQLSSDKVGEVHRVVVDTMVTVPLSRSEGLGVRMQTRVFLHQLLGCMNAGGMKRSVNDVSISDVKVKRDASKKVISEFAAPFRTGGFSLPKASSVRHRSSPSHSGAARSETPNGAGTRALVQSVLGAAASHSTAIVGAVFMLAIVLLVKIAWQLVFPPTASADYGHLQYEREMPQMHASKQQRAYGDAPPGYGGYGHAPYVEGHYPHGTYPQASGYSQGGAYSQGTSYRDGQQVAPDGRGLL